MTPSQLKSYLLALVSNNVQSSLMIWGAPGIGKSAIVAQVAEQASLKIIDLRLSQLAPTDLRGLPVAGKGTSHWYPPEFLPTEGEGILFLDEINMAPPAMQGIAQQLILDRKVGSYELPDGWFVWSAGNKKEHRASVFDMPAPLANRFLHFSIEANIDDFRTYCHAHGLSYTVSAFLSFRVDLLHSMNFGSEAWPSPRSWVMAEQLYRCQLDITPAVGDAAASEFMAFVKLTEQVPDIPGILAGTSKPEFPEETSLKYATVMALVAQAKKAEQAFQALLWLIDNTTAEWVQLFVTDLFPVFRANKQYGKLQAMMMNDDALKEFLANYVKLLTDG